MVKVKIKTVIGYPEEIITKLTDLIIKEEVNVVLFKTYEKMFSPEDLEEKLSKSININNGWETEYFYVDDERSGLKFHRQGEECVEDEDVEYYVFMTGTLNFPHIFPDDMETQIDVITKNYVRSILPELIKEGLSLGDIIKDKDMMWDSVVELVGDLDKDVQNLYKTYMDIDDFTLWDYTHRGLRDRIEMEFNNLKMI